MKIIRDKVTILLTEREREAIEIVKTLVNDIFYDLSDAEQKRFDGIMRASWGGRRPDDVNVGILDLSCLLDDFQNNIYEFNNGGGNEDG